MKQKFNKRKFISINLLISFLIIFVTGIVLYIKPVGKVARAIDWKLFGLDKTEWESIHIVFSYCFVVFAVIHIFSLNQKIVWFYLKSGIKNSKEIIIAFAISLAILAGIIYQIPPFSTIIEIGDYFTDRWEKYYTN